MANVVHGFDSFNVKTGLAGTSKRSPALYLVHSAGLSAHAQIPLVTPLLRLRRIECQDEGRMTPRVFAAVGEMIVCENTFAVK